MPTPVPGVPAGVGQACSCARTVPPQPRGQSPGWARSAGRWLCWVVARLPARVQLLISGPQRWVGPSATQAVAPFAKKGFPAHLWSQNQLWTIGLNVVQPVATLTTPLDGGQGTRFCPSNWTLMTACYFTAPGRAVCEQVSWIRNDKSRVSKMTGDGSPAAKRCHLQPARLRGEGAPPCPCCVHGCLASLALGVLWPLSGEVPLCPGRGA